MGARQLFDRPQDRREETRQMIRIDHNTLHAIRIGLRWPGRAKLGATQAEFAWLLGYRGKYETRKSYMSLLESGRATITPRVAQLALMLELFGVPSELTELETTGKESRS
jgi:hypothetical protein